MTNLTHHAVFIMEYHTVTLFTRTIVIIRAVERKNFSKNDQNEGWRISIGNRPLSV